MRFKKFFTALLAALAMTGAFAQDLSKGVWTNILDMGNSVTFVNVNETCPYGEKYGFKALLVAPYNTLATVKNGVASACVDFSKINRQSTKFWIYIPGEKAIDMQTGVGQNEAGYYFAFKALAVPGPASQNLTPKIVHAIAREKTIQVENRKWHADLDAKIAQCPGCYFSK